MSITRSFAISIFVIMFLIPLVYAQDLSGYRNYNLGMTLAAVAAQADMKVSEARLISERPAVIQELEWRPENSYNSSAQADPVSVIRFVFYSDELYRILVSYNHDRTNGLTNDDLIESISVKYRTPTNPAETIRIYSSSYLYSQDEQIIARWENSQYSYNLFRSSYQSTPGMLIFSKRLEPLAQAAIVEANRLDAQEAPQREIDRKRKRDEENYAAGQKVRPVNKANFRP
ncbi:MAG: hypothetical protein JXR49_14200 [Acidobacteria bacterium]|nr:hypothetical protein [Acidobacteriota bacterium]